MLTERNDEKRGRLSLLTQLRHSSSSLWAAQSWFQLGFFSGTRAVRECRQRPDESRRLKSPQVDPSVIKKKKKIVGRGYQIFYCAWAESERTVWRRGSCGCHMLGLFLSTTAEKKNTIRTFLLWWPSQHTPTYFFVLLFISTTALGVSLLTFLSASERSSRVGDPVASDRGEQFVVRSVCFITVVQHPSNSRATFPGHPN